MSRVYTRKFDWDEARRLRDSGLTYQAIGDRFGVTDSAIWRALNDAARANERKNDWQRQGTCIECGGPCTRTGGQSPHRCRPCAARLAATSARDGELRCIACRVWKPDEDFPHNRVQKYGRRGRHDVCRGCQAAMRQRARLGRRIPCVRCGELRLHPADGGRGRHNDTGLCRRCYLESRRAA